MFIYVIVCSESLKLYVGQHKGADLGKYLSKKWYDAHRYSDLRSHLYAAMRKYPRHSWSIHPLASEVENREELDALEQHYIRVLKTQHPDVGYNLCRGGEGFTGPHTNETKEKIRQHATTSFQTGHIVTAAMRHKISQAGRGRKQSPQTQERRRQSLKQWHQHHDSRAGRASKQQIVELYESGSSLTTVGKQVHLHGQTVRALLKRWGIPRRSESDAMRLVWASGQRGRR